MQSPAPIAAAQQDAGAIPARRRVIAASGSWPIWFGLALYAVTTGLVVASSLRLTAGHWVYAIDDPYITMAMAKNLASHGVWGITPFAFSSSCSSPLFLLVIAGIYRATGPQVWVPLALSWSFGFASVLAAHSLLRHSVLPRAACVGLAALVLFTPLFVVGTLGMEHSLHLLLCLLFLRGLNRIEDGRGLAGLCALAAAMCGVRYEGLLLVAVVAGILACRRRWIAAAALSASAWMPVLLYALYSVTHGGSWLPNSVLLKGLRGERAGLAERLQAVVVTLASNVYRGLPLALLLAALLVLLVLLLRAARPEDRTVAERQSVTLLQAVCGATALHLLLADVGWVFRYEDYLIGSGVVVAALALSALLARSQRLANVVACVFALAALLLGVRAGLAGSLLPRYARAISLQQAQTAEFLARYYPEASIAAGDVGLINFRNDLHCLDLTGLANTQVFEAKRAGRFTTAEIGREARASNVQIAVVYDSWFTNDPAKRKIPLFGPPLPATWVRVGRWTVPETLQLGDKTVSFYAVTPDAVAPLRQHLREFRTALPPQVKVEEN